MPADKATAEERRNFHLGIRRVIVPEGDREAAHEIVNVLIDKGFMTGSQEVVIAWREFSRAKRRVPWAPANEAQINCFIAWVCEKGKP